MNKFFTKIASLSVGLALAIGVGVAIGNNTSKAARSETITWTSVASLSEGDEVVFAYQKSSTRNELSGISNNIGTATSYSTNNNPAGTFLLTVGIGSKSGSFTFKNGSNYLNKGGNGKLTTSTSVSATSSWTISGSAGSIKLINVSDTSYKIQYNASSPRFCNYTSNQTGIILFKKTTSYSIAYNNNTGSGTMSPTTGTNPAVAACIFTAPTGHQFDHWNTSASDSGDTYAVGATPKKDLTLYAIWSKLSYKVIETINNGSLSSTADVKYYDPLDITLNPSTGYKLPDSLESIKMGGSPVADAYTSSSGRIYIEHVTGEVEIKATCPSASSIKCNIQYIRSGCITDGPATIYSTETININVTPLEHYTLTDSTVNVTGTLNDWSYLNGVITIDKPTTDITISVTCPQKSHPSIGTSLKFVSAKEGNPTNVWEDETASLYFEADEGYALPETISISGTTAYKWDKSLGKLDVTGQTSNISITITGEEKTLISISISPTSGEHKLGDIFVAPTVTATFNSGSEIINNYEIEASCLDMDDLMFINEGDDQSIVFKYSYGGGEPMTATYTADVSRRVPTTGGWMEVTKSRTDFSGEYVICSDYILGNDISSNRVTNNGTPAIADGKLSTEVTNAMKWTISKSGDNYTIQNVGNSLYLSSNGTKNQAALLETPSDKSTWTIEYSTTDPIGFIIENVSNKAGSVNYTLRNNGDYGWAAYGSSTGTAPRLFEYVPPVENVLVKVTAEIKPGNRFQGDVLTADDFVVTAHYANGESSVVTSDITITNAELELVGTNKVTVSYGGKKIIKDVTALAPATVTSVDLVVPAEYEKDYIQGDDPLEWNLTGLTVHCVWSNPDLNEDLILSDLISAGQASISPSIPTVGTESFTVSYTYYGTSISTGTATVTGIEVIDDPVESISWTGTKTGEFDVYNSDTLTADEASKWTVKRTYAVKSDVVIPYEEYDILINDEKVALPYDYKVGDTKITVRDPESGKVNNRTLKVTADEIVSIEATCDKSFKVGESITKSDITLKATYQNPNREKETINDFTFEDYQFIYSDAASGGEATEKSFTITYSDKSCTLTVNASREAYTPATGSTYVINDFTNVPSGSNTNRHTGTYTVYAGETGFDLYFKNAYYYSTSNPLQFGKNIDGEVYNDDPLSAPLSDISVDFANITGSIWLSETNEDDSWVEYSNADFTNGNYYYFWIDYSNHESESINVYATIRSITLKLKGNESAKTLSDYVMFEDTPNQCESKFDSAEIIFNGLSDEEKSTFMTSNDYVIRTARERLIDWAKHHGKSIVASDDTYVIRAFRSPLMVIDPKTTSVSIVVILSSIVAVGAFAGYFYYKKKKED